MPMYTVSSIKPLPIAHRQQLAQMITQIHCDLTGAPPQFVTTIFSHGVPIERQLQLHILGTVRKGRSAELTAELTQRLRQQISERFEWPQHNVHVALTEVPASWVMEGGEILPEPGQEANCAWLLAQHAPHRA